MYLYIMCYFCLKDKFTPKSVDKNSQAESKGTSIFCVLLMTDSFPVLIYNTLFCTVFINGGRHLGRGFAWLLPLYQSLQQGEHWEEHEWHHQISIKDYWKRACSHVCWLWLWRKKQCSLTHLAFMMCLWHHLILLCLWSIKKAKILKCPFLVERA